MTPTADEQARRTRRYVLLGVLLFAAYDLWAWLRYGGPATVSTAVGEWMAAPVWGWLVCGIVGGLAGHLAGMLPTSAPNPLGRLAVFGLSVAALYLLTAMS